MKIWPELQELLFPTRCLGCHELGLSLCSSCRTSWHPHIYRGTSRWQVAAPQQQIFPIYSAITYSPVASKVLLAAKESGIVLADQLLNVQRDYPKHKMLQRLTFRLVAYRLQKLYEHV